MGCSLLCRDVESRERHVRGSSMVPGQEQKSADPPHTKHLLAIVLHRSDCIGRADCLPFSDTGHMIVEFLELPCGYCGGCFDEGAIS